MNQSHLSVEQLVDYLHGELSPQEDATVHAHLAECRFCSEAYDTEAALSGVLRAHASAEERELPESVVARIRDAIERERSSTAWQWLAAALRPAIALPVAAALAFALYLSATAWHGVGTTTIDATDYVENHAALAATTPFAQESALPTMLTSDDAVTEVSGR
jgi:predicted anti-sigma-YlaC factor YlaD